MLAQATPTLNVNAPSTTWIILAAAVVVLLIVAAAILARHRRSEHLHDRFGSEYDRALIASGSRSKAESDLAAREKRHRELEIRPLTPGARSRYFEEWRAVQARFVDSPEAAIREADKLVGDVMRDRGYPVEEYDQRVSDLSVDHAGDLDHYRAAHAISLKNDAGDAGTEDLRQAMIHYRALFDSLLGEPARSAAGKE